MADFSAFAYASNSGTTITWGGTTQYTLGSYGQLGIAITAGSYPSVSIISDCQFRHSVSGSGYTFSFTDSFTFVPDVTYYIYFYFCTTTSVTAYLFGTATASYTPVSTITVTFHNYDDAGNILESGEASGASGAMYRLNQSGTQYIAYTGMGYTLSYYSTVPNPSEYEKLTDPNIYLTFSSTVTNIYVHYFRPRITVSVENYKGSDRLVSGSYTGYSGSSFLITYSGTQYQAYIGDPYNYQFLYFTLSSEGHYSQHGTSYQIPIVSGQVVRAYYRSHPTIPYFYWTGSDSSDQSRISAGQPITNLTAEAWCDLVDKITAIGGSTYGFTRPSSGDLITAAIFNEVRNAIANLGQSVTGQVTKNVTQVTATTFANDYYALKEAVNRAIAAYNNS